MRCAFCLVSWPKPVEATTMLDGTALCTMHARQQQDVYDEPEPAPVATPGGVT